MRSLRHLALPLVLCLCAGAPAPRAGATDFVLVRVLAGQSHVVNGGARRILLVGDGSVAFAGESFLSLAPGASVEVRARGAASVRLVGPAEVEWAAAPSSWRIASFNELDAEVRRGELVLLLGAEGWLVRARGGAFHARRLAGGEVELLHHAGPALEARSLDGERTLVLEAGRRARLPAAPAPR